MSTPSLDLTRLQELAAYQVDGQPDMVSEIVAMFISESVRRIDEATRGAATGDQPLLKRAAHSLRGGCGTVGALRMSELALELEAAAGASATAGLIESITDEFARVRELLRLAE
jgi:HPt (histidine-containing phosphotransfer) domain-containing protein